MNKKPVQQRKQTVTVVLGPKTVKLMEQICAEMRGKAPAGAFNFTCFVGAALNECLESWRKTFISDGDLRRIDHYE